MLFVSFLLATEDVKYKVCIKTEDITASQIVRMNIRSSSERMNGISRCNDKYFRCLLYFIWYEGVQLQLKSVGNRKFYGQLHILSIRGSIKITVEVVVAKKYKDWIKCIHVRSYIRLNTQVKKNALFDTYDDYTYYPCYWLARDYETSLWQV